MSDSQERLAAPGEPEPEKLGAPEERIWELKPEFTPEMLAEMEKLLPGKLNRVVATSLSGCIHCGMCSDACHYSVSIPEDKTLIPAYKLDRFRKWYKYRYDWIAKFSPASRAPSLLRRNSLKTCLTSSSAVAPCVDAARTTAPWGLITALSSGWPEA